MSRKRRSSLRCCRTWGDGGTAGSVRDAAAVATRLARPEEAARTLAQAEALTAGLPNPADAELREHSARFAELWDTGAAGLHDAARKTIDHALVGPLTLDCDVLSVAGSDLRIMVYTAEPGTEDAERLALLMVLGTQDVQATQ